MFLYKYVGIVLLVCFSLFLMLLATKLQAPLTDPRLTNNELNFDGYFLAVLLFS